MTFHVPAAVIVIAGAVAAHAQRPVASPPAGSVQMSAGPAYTAAGELIRPDNFREWIFVTSGLGMTYNQPTGASRAPSFTNVYVNPAAYHAFVKSGQWPDKTMFILEVRASTSEGSINKGGQFQAQRLAVEVHVKDKRYKSGWAFFNFRGEAPGIEFAQTSACNVCHEKNAAVDTTFVQFYPTLLPIAVENKTLSPAYLEAQKVAVK